jgi:hypothetical protein
MAMSDGEVLGKAELYTEIIANIRATDEISFKLLGLVPLVSGTALVAVILQDVTARPTLIVLFALFAAAVTLGLFRWELRNVQECSRLLRHAEALAEPVLEQSGVPAGLRRRAAGPQGVGKTEAEKLVYSATIAAWLVLPLALGAVRWDAWRTSTLAVTYLVIAGLILLCTVASLFAGTRVTKDGSPSQ